MTLKGSRVLVTGGAGFIGSHLVKRLLVLGAKVRVLDDLSSGKISNLSTVRDDIDLLHGTILDPELLARAANGVEAVFHLAAVVSVSQTVEKPIESDQVNSLGTLMVLEEARKTGARVVFSSSAAVYGDGPLELKREDSATIPLSPYGVQKLTGEKYLTCYASLYGLKGCSLRYFNVYGPRQDSSSPYSGVISRFANLASSGSPLCIYGDGEQTRDFIYVGDVVEANLAAARSEAGGGEAINIGTGSTVTLKELAKIIKKLSGSRSEITHLPARAGDIRFSCADISKASDYLGFAPETSIEKGLQQTLTDIAKSTSDIHHRNEGTLSDTLTSR